MRADFRLACSAMVMVAGIAGLTVPAGATTLVRRLSFEEVTTDSVRIVHGTVTAAQSGRDASGLPATWVTVAVARTLKGNEAGTVTIKQLGTAEPLPDGAITRVAGMPRYQVGEEVVLFLRGDSRRGFTSPVGLEQGVYRVRDGLVRGGLLAKPEALDTFVGRVGRLTGWGR